MPGHDRAYVGPNFSSAWPREANWSDTVAEPKLGPTYDRPYVCST
jgi:hypothetical protein